MSPSAVLRPAEPHNARARRLRPVYVVVAFAALAAVIPVARLAQSQRFVPHVIFDNPTAYDLDVTMTTAARDGWTPVATAIRKASTPAEEVYDVGDKWVFRLTTQGQPAGEMMFGRHALERAKWHVAIPPSIEEGLRGRGVSPPP